MSDGTQELAIELSGGNKELLPLAEAAIKPATTTTEMEASDKTEALEKEEVAAEGKKADLSGPISDADREKFGIPAKFKDWGAVVKWGSEAEKAKSKAESEKGELERKAREYEEMLLELKKDDAPKSGVSDTEKAQMAAKFQEDFNADPIGTMQNLFREFENRIQSREQKTVQEQTWAREEKEISSAPEYKEIWDSEVKPALIAIAKERPYLNSLEEVVAIYERRKAREKEFNAQDSEVKKTAKKAASTEAGGSTGGISEDLMKHIASAKSQDDMAKIAAKMGMK
jgi:hypothetical protein